MGGGRAMHVFPLWMAITHTDMMAKRGVPLRAATTRAMATGRGGLEV